MSAKMPTRDRIEHLSAPEFFVRYIRKFCTVYVVVLSFIMLFECCMIVRAVYLFDFGRWIHRLYMVSYVFLMAATPPERFPRPPETRRSS